MKKECRKLSELVGRNIQKRRKTLGISQGALAEQIGIGQQSLSAMERGEIAPKFERLPLIAAQLNCPVSDLFRILDEETQKVEKSMADLLHGLEQDEKSAIIRVSMDMAQIFRQHRAALLASGTSPDKN